MEHPLVTVLLSIITALMGYATLWQKRERVDRGRPVLRFEVRVDRDGGGRLSVVNEGERPAVALSLAVGSVPGRLHRDVLARSDAIEAELPVGAPTPWTSRSTTRTFPARD